MREWLSRNAALVLAVGLPLALVMFFMLAAILPKWLVAPPQYDLLYLTGYSDAIPTNRLRFQVQGGHAVFSFMGENFSRKWPEIHRFSPATRTVTDITIPVPPKLHSIAPYNRPVPPMEEEIITPVPVPAIADMHIESSPIAPDGYIFHRGDDNRSLLSDIFFGPGRYPNNAKITKNGYVINIPQGDGPVYAPATFIGWIVP